MKTAKEKAKELCITFERIINGNAIGGITDEAKESAIECATETCKNINAFYCDNGLECTQSMVEMNLYWRLVIDEIKNIK